MRRFFDALVPGLVLPVTLFIMLSYPVIDLQIRERLPLLTAYYLSRQLDSQISRAESRNDGNPINYGDILRQYGSLPEHVELMKLKELSGSPPKLFFTQRLLAGLILWREGLPPDFLQVDPLDNIERKLDALRSKQKLTNARWEKIISKHVLECLKYRPPDPLFRLRLRKELPPRVRTNGLVFCGEKIPISRQDVRRRIEYQIDYLLVDLIDTTYAWLKRKDRYGAVIKTILAEEDLPEEFCLLPALESGYNGTVISPSRATGWWQFVKPTALGSRGKNKELDWGLQVTPWRDDRKDLSLSTRSAARYLKWIRLRLSGDSGPVSWLLAAAAYNAGLSKVSHRMWAYKSTCFWDIKLPRETEDYVPRWIAFSVIDTNREFYGLGIDHVAPLAFDTLYGIKLTKDLPFSILATMTGCSVRFIREINPALKTDERSFRAKRNNKTLVHTIHIPKGNKDLVRKFLKAGAYVENGA